MVVNQVTSTVIISASRTSMFIIMMLMGQCKLLIRDLVVNKAQARDLPVLIKYIVVYKQFRKIPKIRE